MRIYCSDCEGPATIDDDAQGQAEYFIDNGAHVFSITSGYDDALTIIDKRPNYRAGMTLQLMLPLLAAAGATNQAIAEYSAKHITFVPGAKQTIAYIANLMPTFIISTSWDSYIREVCYQLSLPFAQAVCSKLPDLSSFEITDSQKSKLRDIAKKIAQMPEIEILPNATSRQQLSEETRAVVTRLDEIFWQQIPIISPGAAQMYEKPIVMGGPQKAEAVVSIAKERECSLANVIYIGDSITDVQALEMVKKAGGVAISFNGNRYALEAAEIAVIAEKTFTMYTLALAFKEEGPEYVINLAQAWSKDIPVSYQEAKLWGLFPVVTIVTDDNRQALIKLSSETRKIVRGRAGELG